MKSKRQKQKEAQDSLRERLGFWEEMAQTGKTSKRYGGFTPSNNDQKFLDGYLDPVEGRKALANRKIQRLTRDFLNLGNKL